MSHRFMRMGLLALAAALLPALSSYGAIIAFEGTRSNVNPLGAPGTGRCAPLNTVNIAPGALSSLGMSNLGAFTSTQSHCIPGRPSASTPVQPISDGRFLYDFGLDGTLIGVYTGLATFADDVITGNEHLLVEGGTGRFAGASGFIDSIGTLSIGPSPSGVGFAGFFEGSLSGRLELVQAPAPHAALLLLSGLLAMTRLRGRSRTA